MTVDDHLFRTKTPRVEHLLFSTLVLGTFEAKTSLAVTHSHVSRACRCGRHVAANPSPLALPSVCKTTFNVVAQATANGLHRD